MSERRRPEKQEEKREKDEEKRSEKEWHEKWQRNPVRVLTLATILIWGGIVALLDTANVVTASWWNGGAIFLIGTGVILLVKAAVRTRPAFRRPVGGTIIIALVLIGIGLGTLIGWNYGWPIILIAIGVIIIALAVFRRR